MEDSCVKGQEIQFQIIRDAITNYSATLFSACLGIMMIPIMLKGLGIPSYGLLITSLMTGSMLPVDLGLGWSLTREIARQNGKLRRETSQFVSGAGNIFLVLGFCGSLLIFMFGLLFARLHHESGQPANVVRIVFALAGLGFLGEHMQIYVLSVLHGSRRFAHANLILIAAATARALGSLLLLRSGAQVIAIAAWQAFASLGAAIFGIALISCLDPALGWRFKIPAWRETRDHFGFALSSQATMTGTNWIWQSTPFLAGLIRGPSYVVPFYIGQRFPLSVSILNWKAAEPIFPAASAIGQTVEDLEKVLLSGTRWITAVSLPFCIFLWITAPTLLQLWLGAYPHSAVLILRLTTAAVFADSLGVGAMHFLLARGESKWVLITTVAIAIATALISGAILYLFGASYAIWGLLLPMLAGAFIMLWLSHEACGIGLWRFFRMISRLIIPASIFASIVWSGTMFAGPQSPALLAAIGAASMMGYVLAIFYCGLSRREKYLVRRFLSSRYAAGPAATQM